jgi:hypothetical protein
MESPVEIKKVWEGRLDEGAEDFEGPAGEFDNGVLFREEEFALDRQRCALGLRG